MREGHRGKWNEEKCKQTRFDDVIHNSGDDDDDGKMGRRKLAT
jgi:hypothetical protein